MDYDKMCKVKEDVELLINNIDPKSKLIIYEDTILKSNYNKQLLKDIVALMDEFIFFNAETNNLNKRRKHGFYITAEKRKQISISQSPISISTFAYIINEFVDNEVMKKVKASEITAWLMEQGYLKEITHEDGKIFKVLTDKASDIGMLKENKTNSFGRNYDINLYSLKAQQFIIDNLDNICSK
ncbi:hypothetical protein [Clostridium algidicarnis]|uniref:hypothetical protein n=1 Tax=Clostridium algidicarnis TaxID=37659 RepID=UPI001C0E6C28|nr:hypothetical protein [Clostridium algidicarnis]MBU3228775.1 hypothetical protein [Clostridium algidicarnis]MBU3252319.1 hypothetical protein [Clostridium algidicarnis]